MCRVCSSGCSSRWHGIDPCYVFHVGNAHEDADGDVVLDAVRYRDADVAGLWRTIGGDSGVAERITGGTLHRWTLGDAVKEEQLDDRIVEFPTINDLLTGREARYRYTVTGDAVVKYDLDTGGSLAAAVGGRAGEAVYVPRGDEEDDGWLLSINAESLLVHDARDLRQVAAVRLPRRVPAGFHGTWLPDE
ncbi:carotenoid oxygenase family protein [Nonomuraea sp. NPDC050556]|uniref:carotenoid oxygenase family protein n=1 Tax=Nonomuraea sp. NPDC050556 TaxID=3364369 RepID=UPI00379546AF